MSVSDDQTSVTVDIRIEAPAATVYRYLCSGEGLSQWLGAAVEMDPRPGGRLRIDFARFGTVVAGEVVELVPDRGATFTWGVESGPQHDAMPPGATRVTITLEPDGTGTRLTLRHSGLPSEKERRDHEGGWRFYADQISRVAGDELARLELEAAITSYVAALNCDDDAERARLLAASWADEGEMKSRHAHVRGRDALVAHVAGARRMMPGARLEQVGAVDVLRGHARYGWRLLAADGSPAATGTNFCDLAPDGRLARVVGFWD